jgi:hypothetical protein
MVYPFLPDAFIDRKKVVGNRIYVPQWWKYVASLPQATEWERDLSANLLPLPIDHRYGECEMEEMCDVMERELKY